MAPSSRVVSIAILGTALGGTLIALLAALLRRRKNVKNPKPPDVLNEAQLHGLSTHATGGRVGKTAEEETGTHERVEDHISVVRRSPSTMSHASEALTITYPNTTQCTTQQLCHLGNQYLQMSERLWEEALARSSLEHTSQTISSEHLQVILTKARDLLRLYQAEFESDVALDAAIGALQQMDEDYEVRREKRGRNVTSDSDSLDSFVSAPETPDLTDLEDTIAITTARQHLYEVGLLELQHNYVPYRKLRTKTVGCDSDSEFLAKLHVLRIAFEQIMKVDANRKWFMETGKKIITCILNKADRDPSDFLLAMEKMENFLPEESNFDILKIELGMRGVKCFTLYDVVLDWVLMDAFEDLSNPPSSVLTVVENRWLSSGLKETAISTAVWSILKAKRSLLKYPDGFISKFYAISESVSPVLAWAFLGPEGELKSACLSFKLQCMGFIQDIFSHSKVRYTVYEDITADIMSVAKERAVSILPVIENSSSVGE